MKTVTVGIVAGAAILLVLGYKFAKKAIDGFSFEITGYGRPTISGYELAVPLKVQTTNPTSLPINVDRLDADIYLNKMGNWVLAGQVSQPVAMQPGTSEEWLYPRVNLQNVFGGDVIQTLSALAELQRTKKLELRADVGAQYGAVSIPKQSFTQTVDI